VCVAQHDDFVTAIDFHPTNDKLFLSGSLDERLRLWSIPEHRVEHEVRVCVWGGGCYTGAARREREREVSVRVRSSTKAVWIEQSWEPHREMRWEALLTALSPIASPSLSPRASPSPSPSL